MENNANIKPKKSGIKIFVIGFFTALILSGILAGWVTYQNKLRQDEEAKNYAAHEAQRLDSVAKADKVVRRYFGMVKYLSRQDSIFASLKYKVGDIVYLKPDSLIGVVQNVIGDDKMDCFTYFIVCKNKDGEYEVIQRNIKLIY